MVVTLEVDVFPPSENKAYPTIMVKGRPMRKPSTELKKFKREFNELVWDLYEKELDALVDALGCHMWLRVSADFYLPAEDVISKGWAKVNRAGQRAAKQRYKKMDVHNFVKALADGLDESLKVDDHRFQWGHLTKNIDSRDPRMVVRLEVVDPSDYGVPLEYAQAASDDTMPGLR